MCCDVLQCVAVCCSVLHRVAAVYKCVSFGTPREHALEVSVAVCISTLQCVAVCCSVLQCVAVCCSVLQCVGEVYKCVPFGTP